MGRKGRQASKVGLYHVILRGNNKGRLFHEDKDFRQFLCIVQEKLNPECIKIHHYCLMSNHVHLLIWTENIGLLSQWMHYVQRSYHHYYRKQYKWFGHLFQGRYRSLPIEDEEYLIECGRYIERNPVRAKMVKKAQDWPYSSYRFYIWGEKNQLISSSIAYEALAEDEDQRRKIYQERVEMTRPYEEVLDRELVG